MSWCADLSTTTPIDTGEHIRAVGWLSAEHPFSTGSVPSIVFERVRLFSHACAASTNALGWSICLGWHDCDLCEHHSCTGIFGVPDGNVLYVVPEMIVHYIEVHQYRPPPAFLAAVVRSPVPDTASYHACVAPFRRAHHQYLERCQHQRIGLAARWARDHGGDEHAIEDAARAFFCDPSPAMCAHIQQAMVQCDRAG